MQRWCSPLLGFLLLAGLTAASVPADEVWLDELDVTQSTCGWNSTKARLSVQGNPLKAADRQYDRGVGTHPPGQIYLELDGRVERFTAQVGIDDEVGDAGNAEFILYGDEKELWRSGLLKGSDGVKPVNVDLKGVKYLRLLVSTGPDGYGCDHTDWLEARFTYSGQPPRVTRPQARYVYLEDKVLDRFDELGAEFGWIQWQIAHPMPSHVAEQAYRPEANILPTDRDPVDVVLRRVRALLECLQTRENAPDLTAEQQQLDELDRHNSETAVDNETARKKLFAEAVKLRRRVALSNPLLDFDKILFIKRHFNPEPEMQGNHMCDQFFGFHAIRGGGLFVLENPFSDRPTVRNLLENSVCQSGRFQGRKLTAEQGYLAPELSFDGRTIYFACTDIQDPPQRYTWTEENCYHIFKVNVDGTGLEQLTDGAWNDFDPCLMPNGRLAFISERRGGYGRCHGRPVPSYTLHSMNADGSDIVMLSPHETNEWQPSVDNDGMIVYTRWDYVDRGFNQAHHPWITTPDGRDSRPIHGNYGRAQSARPHFEADIRAVPDSNRLTATASCHHGQAYGSLVLIDPRVPDDDAMGPVRRITPDQLFPEAECATHGGPATYATVWPLSDDFYLCVHDPFAHSDRGPENNFGIYLLDGFGNRVLLYRDPAISCLSPIPLRPRVKPPVVPHQTLVAKPLAPGEKFEPVDPATLPRTSAIGVVNVYDSIRQWPPRTVIKRLRIVQLLPKTTPYAHNPAIGYGNQKGARKILGTVPVEADGSAYFELPVNVPVYFQALDEQGMAVQSMRSATYVHPGERLVCQGCHEDRYGSPKAAPTHAPLAMQRSASSIQPDPEGTNPLNYPHLIQPIWDKHCVDCHAREPNAMDLSRGDASAHFFKSYENLRPYVVFFDDAAWTEPNTLPGRFGANVSRLWKILDEGHHDVKLSPEEKYRIMLWLDNNSDFYGAYEQCDEQRRGQIIQPTLE